MKHGRRYRRIAIAMAIFFVMGLGVVLAQRMSGRGRRGGGYYGGGDGQYGLPPRDIFPSNTFTFCRIQYDSDFSGGRYGGGWQTDFPESDLNFSRRLAEMTTINVNHTADGKIKHVVVRLTDPDVFKYPFIYMDEVGALSFSQAERDALKSYLFRGGFLMVDDFWGDQEWGNWKEEFQQVLPPEQFPIVEVPLSHELFHIVFDIKEVPQIPGIGFYRYWQQTGDSCEPGHDYSSNDKRAHCRGVFDKNGRLMCVFMNNTDNGDGWEEESTNEGFFRDFSVKKAYPMGINIVVYAMTH